MLTPNEVMNQRFDKQAFGGYSLEQIDEFLQRLTTDYATLYKDNTLLKSKLKSLVTTIEEYRRVEEGMRKTLLNSQQMADSLIQDARAEAQRIVEQAGATVAGTTGDLEERIRREEARLAQVKQQTIAFSNVIRELFTRQMQMLDAVPSDVDGETPIPHEAAENRLQDAAREIEQNLTAQLDAVKDTMSFAFVQGDGNPVSQDTALMPTMPDAFPSETVFVPGTAPTAPVPTFEPAQPMPPTEPPMTFELPQPASVPSAEPIMPFDAPQYTAPQYTAPAFSPPPPEAAPQEQAPAHQFEFIFEPPAPTQTPAPTAWQQQEHTPQPEEPTAPPAGISTTALQDTLTRLRQMDSGKLPDLSAANANKDAEAVLQRLLQGGDEAMANGVEDTTANLPKIDFDALNFGSNYKPGE